MTSPALHAMSWELVCWYVDVHVEFSVPMAVVLPFLVLYNLLLQEYEVELFLRKAHHLKRYVPETGMVTEIPVDARLLPPPPRPPFPTTG